MSSRTSDTPRFEQVLERELIQAEGLRAKLMAALVAGSSAFGGVLLLDLPLGAIRPGLGRSPGLFICLGGLLFAAFELLIWVRVQRTLRGGFKPPPWASWVLVGAESLLPTLVLLALSRWIDDPTLLGSPLVLIYALAIATTPLRLEPRLSLFSGLVSGGSYLLLARILLGAGEIVAPNHSGMTTFLARAFYLLMIGGAAAFVAQQLRLRLRHTADALEQRNRVVGVFGRYLSDEVVDLLINDPQGLRLGGIKSEVTLLMTDLRGFSNISERMEPEKVVTLLNHYLGAMTEVITRHGGTIDEFIGDAILVIWNAPLPQADHARLAVRCALAMQLEMGKVNAWNRERGLPVIEMGVGIHTGDVIVGNIGSPKRQKYGVVGSTVNLTARVESYTVGGQVLITNATAGALGEGMVVRSERDVYPKGATAAVRLYEVEGLDELRLPTLGSALREIPPLAVQVRPLHGKDLAPDSFPGTLTALSVDEALLRCESSLEIWQNLALNLGDGQCFAKVMARDDGYRLRFTSLDEAARRARDAALGSEG